MVGKLLAVLAKSCVTRPVGQAVKTRPFHGCNMGSIPVRVTKKEESRRESLLSFLVFGKGSSSPRRGCCLFKVGILNQGPSVPDPPVSRIFSRRRLMRVVLAIISLYRDGLHLSCRGRRPRCPGRALVYRRFPCNIAPTTRLVGARYIPPAVPHGDRKPHPFQNLFNNKGASLWKTKRNFAAPVVRRFS